MYFELGFRKGRQRSKCRRKCLLLLTINTFLAQTRKLHGLSGTLPLQGSLSTKLWVVLLPAYKHVHMGGGILSHTTVRNKCTDSPSRTLTRRDDAATATAVAVATGVTTTTAATAMVVVSIEDVGLHRRWITTGQLLKNSQPDIMGDQVFNGIARCMRGYLGISKEASRCSDRCSLPGPRPLRSRTARDPSRHWGMNLFY